MALTDRELAAIEELANHEGWHLVASEIASRQDRIGKALAQDKFHDLLEVGRLQGRHQAFQEVLNYVNSRQQRARKG